MFISVGMKIACW